MAKKNWVELIGEPKPLPNVSQVEGPTPEEIAQWTEELEHPPQLAIIFSEGELEELMDAINPIRQYTT